MAITRVHVSKCLTRTTRSVFSPHRTWRAGDTVARGCKVLDRFDDDYSRRSHLPRGAVRIRIGTRTNRKYHTGGRSRRISLAQAERSLPLTCDYHDRRATWRLGDWRATETWCRALARAVCVCVCVRAWCAAVRNAAPPAGQPTDRTRQSTAKCPPLTRSRTRESRSRLEPHDPPNNRIDLLIIL